MESTTKRCSCICSFFFLFRFSFPSSDLIISNRCSFFISLSVTPLKRKSHICRWRTANAETLGLFVLFPRKQCRADTFVVVKSKLYQFWLVSTVYPSSFEEMYFVPKRCYALLFVWFSVSSYIRQIFTFLFIFPLVLSDATFCSSVVF